MPSPGSYLLSAVALAALGLSLGFSAFRLRRRLLPGWQGAPARLVESILFLSLLIWLSELLGCIDLFRAWSLVASALLLAGALAWRLGPAAATSAGGAAAGERRGAEPGSAASVGLLGRERTRGQELLNLLVVAVVAVVFAHWGLTTKDALDRGVFNFDSLWYHLPFAVDMAQSHSVTGLHYPETVFTNWFYPQNAELLHAVGISLSHRDTISLFVNFAFLAIAFLAAWCVGLPYGRAQLSTLAAAIVLECHTLVVREPGAAKNDLMAAALLLAGIAILVTAWAAREGPEEGRLGRMSVGWPLAAAGLAVGLAVGTKLTALAMAAALSVAVLALSPAGRRWAAAAWWFLPALAAGGFWYLRNLIAAGNPIPEVESLGPIALPHPERLQSGRPEFSIAHYATDTGVWRHYFVPGLHDAFGLLWPLVVGGALLGGLLALARGRDPVLRWMGATALFGLLAYVLTPLSAAGAEGEPVAFAINIRFAIPALLAGVALLPASVRSAARSGRPPQPAPAGGRRVWGAAIALVVVLIISDRADAVLRDPNRLFGWLVAGLAVLIPAAIVFARRRGASAAAAAAGFAGLALAVAAIAYPVQRSYLRDRFRNRDPATAIPGMGLDFAYRWARDVHDARIGLAGTTAGFQQYGFFGTDLSNRVSYLGVKGPHGSFNAIPDCAGFRAAVNAAGLEYLVTAPFLNFIHPGNPLFSPEGRWLLGDPGVAPLKRRGRVTIWRVRGPLDPRGCGARNAPLRYVPQQPSS